MLVLTCGLLLNFCLKGLDGAEETARESDQAIKATDLTCNYTLDNLLCPFHLKAETLFARQFLCQSGAPRSAAGGPWGSKVKGQTSQSFSHKKKIPQQFSAQKKTKTKFKHAFRFHSSNNTGIFVHPSGNQ